MSLLLACATPSTSAPSQDGEGSGDSRGSVGDDAEGGPGLDSSDGTDPAGTSGGAANPDGSDGGDTTSDADGATDGGTPDDTPDDTADDGPPARPPQKEAVFSYPAALGGDEFADDDAVIASALSLLDHACVPFCDGDVEIRVSMYRLTWSGLTDALLAAAARGADIEVILDGQALNDPAAATLSAAPGDLAVYRCGGPDDDDACIGALNKPNGDAINHNKFMLISALDDASTQIVWQASANATISQLAKANNALIVRDDSALYEQYVAYFGDLRAGALGAEPDPNYYDTSESSVAGDTGTRVYLFPRADQNVADGLGDLEYHVNAEDPILTLLGNLGCEPGDRVVVAMGLWKDERVAIVDRLQSLVEQGCEVEALVRASPERTDPGILAALLAAGVATYDVPHLHSKYVVADSLFKGDPRQLLWTGSHNFTYRALRENDEVLVRVDDPVIHAAYLDNFDTLRDVDGTLLP